MSKIPQTPGAEGRARWFVLGDCVEASVHPRGEHGYEVRLFIRGRKPPAPVVADWKGEQLAIMQPIQTTPNVKA